MRRNSQSIKFTLTLAAICAVSALCMSGCGLTLSQKQAVEQFALATLSAGDAASSELARMRAEVISMNVQRIQLVGENEDQPGLDNLDEAFTIDATMTRQRAIEALVSYGDLLHVLVDTDQDAAIRASSEALIASINDLPESYRKMTPETMNAVRDALQSAGGFWVEWKKARAVRRIVQDASGQIDRLCSLLKDDFDPNADGRLASQFLNTTERLRNEAGQMRDKAKSDQERAMAFAALQKWQENRDRRDKVVMQLSVSIGAIRTANRELVRAVNSVKYAEADLDALQKNVKLLKSALKVLSGT